MFGILGEDEAPLLRPVMRMAMAYEMLENTEHGGLRLGAGARAVLKGEQTVTIAEPPKKSRRRRGGGSEANPVGDPLFDALRARRAELAKEQGVPAYIIFHDSVLRAMASEKPETLSQMGALSGVGAKKLDTWGGEFVQVVRDHVAA